MSAPQLSIVLPVYDEATVLRDTFAQLIPVLAGLGRSFEIVAVNDGSTDGPDRILEELAADAAVPA